MSLADILAKSSLWNPYDFANPVNDHKLFAGRASELQDIRYYLRLAARAPRPINLVLTGPRSSGKTSLLNRIEFEAQERDFVVARVDLNEADVDPFSLFFKVYDAVLFAAVQSGAFAGPTGPIYAAYRLVIDGVASESAQSELLFPSHYANASAHGRALSEPTLKSDLRTISREIGRTCVILFDECDVLGKSRIELEMIRNVFMNTPGFMLVFAGTPNLFPVMEDVFSPIVRQFKKIPVERFSSLNDTIQCIEKPLTQLDIPTSEVLKPTEWALEYEVHELVSGRPYEIQLLCHYMFKRVEDGDARDMEITFDVLEDVRKELEKQESGSDRRSVAALRLLTADDFPLLQALTECEGTVEQLATLTQLFSREHPYDEPTLQAAFDRFEAMGLLSTNSDGAVTFNGDQFDEVYARYYAAANDHRLTIWKGSFQAEVKNVLHAEMAELDGVRPIHVVHSGRTDSRRRLNEALTALLEDVPRMRQLPDDARSLYMPLFLAFDRGEIRFACIRLNLLDQIYEQWIVIEQDDTNAFLTDDQMIGLSERATGIGADIDLELFEQPLTDRGSFLERVQRLATPNQLQSFADDHSTMAFDLYRARDYESSRAHYALAWRFHKNPYYAVALSHVNLIIGDWEEAIRHGESARVNALAEDGDLDQYVIATYDMAVGYTMLDNAERAKALIEECLQDMPKLQFGEGYFTMPIDHQSGELAVLSTIIQVAAQGLDAYLNSARTESSA